MSQKISGRITPAQERYKKTLIWSTTDDYILQQNQTYQHRHRYIMHKYINKNVDIVQL